jgi:hypothetical protein
MIRKHYLIKMIMAFFCVMLLSSCGGGDGVTLIPMPNDDFSSYTTFPAFPWTVYDSSDAGNWTIVDEGVPDGKAARYNPASADYSALINENFWTFRDHSIIARIKVPSPSNSAFGILMHASMGPSAATYYQLYFNNATSHIYFLKSVNGVSTGLLAGTTIAYGGLDTTVYHTYKLSITGSGTATVTLHGYIDGGPEVITDTDDGSFNGTILVAGKTGFAFYGVDDGSITSYQITEP